MSNDGPACAPQVNCSVQARILRRLSPVLFLAGVILLGVSFFYRDVPLVKAGAMTPEMDLEFVKISGTVLRDTRLHSSGEAVFYLDDGSGEVAVKGGRSQTDLLKELNRMPCAGDYVEVAGVLSVCSGKEVMLRMQSAEQLVLRRHPKPHLSLEPDICISEITEAQKGRIVSIAGLLKEIVIPGPGSRAPYILRVEEAGVQMDVVFWESVFQAMGRTLPDPGSSFVVRGEVDVYKGSLQLRLQSADDLVPIVQGNSREEMVDA